MSPHATPMHADNDVAEDNVAQGFRSVRDNSLTLAAPLSPEDWMLQSMEDASPLKWHLAHTTWFFETFLLCPHLPGYKTFHDDFTFLFNSYYQQVGSMHTRARRGLLSRPSSDMVLAYRAHIDAAMDDLIEAAYGDEKIADLICLGCAHEEQHQELMQTDILHGFYQNAMRPAAYSDNQIENGQPTQMADPIKWIGFEGGLVEKGAEGGFCFDNEMPRHKFFLNPFELSHRPVSNRDYLAFIEDGGYQDSRFWLADGWATVQTHGWTAPLYWERNESGAWEQFTLFGQVPLALDAPVRHVSHFEAAAYANWAGAVLPTETEWEVAAARQAVHGHFLEAGKPASRQASGDGEDGALHALFGSVWEWTQSPYASYPGYKPAAGAIGEYNGKFMSSQMVLRGGSSATPLGHMRATYRNFFPPSARWQFSGFRLAR